MTEDKAYLPPAIRAQVVRHSVMQSNKCFNRNLMLNVPDVSPSYALLPGDALHSLIGKGKKVKIKEKIRCKPKKLQLQEVARFENSVSTIHGKKKKY